MGTLTAADIAAMTAQDARQRARRDDDELRLRGVISESRKFDPTQKRDDHGRWSKIGAVLDAIKDAWGDHVKDHEVFGGPDGESSSHGVVAFHGGDDYSLNLRIPGEDFQDGQDSAQGVMHMSREELDSLQYDIGKVLDRMREKPDTGGSLDDGERWKFTWDAGEAVLHANLDDDEALERVFLSNADLDSLDTAIGAVLARSASEDAPYLAKFQALRPGERLVRKREFGGSGEWPWAVAKVEGPDGTTTLRMGSTAWLDPNGYGASLKAYSGGEGPAAALLDKPTADSIADELTDLIAYSKKRQKAISTYDEKLDNGEITDEEHTAALDQYRTPAYSEGHPFVVDGHYAQPREIETPWGTLVMQGYSDELGDWRIDIGVRPKGAVQDEDWSLDGYRPFKDWDTKGHHVTMADGGEIPHGELGPADAKRLADYLRTAFETSSADAGRSAYNELHPHAPKGSAIGGQFVAAKGSGGSSKTTGSKSDPPPETEVGSGKSGKARGPRVRIPKGALGYDPASNHGTGYGVKGGDKRVHTLQQALNRLGFTDMHGKKLRDDGELGPLTTAAVKKAQRALGVKADGIVTPQLLKRIEAMKPNRRRTATAKSATTTKRRSAAMELCTRAFDFEFDSDTRDGRTLEGYAAVFDTPARIRDLQGDFDETIRPGAFKRSLAVRTPVLQFDHGKDPRIGGTPIGKIDALSEDSRGLHVRARLFTHPDVERVREAIAEGAVNGMSFRFGVPDKGDVWGRNADGVDTREIRDADIHELGPVVFPAYDQTSVSVRSLLSQLGPEETRELLHELAGHLGLAVDLQDLTGRPSARSAGGGDIGTSPGVGRVPATPSTRQLLDHGTLRLKGIIK